MNLHSDIAAQLQTRLQELTRRARVIEDDLRQPLDADFEEQALDLADDDSLAGVDEVLRREVHEIRQALLRIERGEYGQCASCGRPISPARLKALPTASLCIGCASAD